ncbi:hypothetical protein [Nocardia colli]|uniref:hypothetical protein n=1 Tax=Nocardia colli TaxID=2545717 RepID=UPI00168CD60A|nr:hypothetical protein [Nocardia colli]
MLGPAAVGAGRDINAPVTVNVSVVSTAWDPWPDRIYELTALAEHLDTEHFHGRKELIARIDTAIAAQDRGYVVVQSEAGIGKTALAAHLVWTRPCVYHFTAFEGGKDPAEARKSLAAQLIRWWDLADKFCPGGNLPAAAERPDWLTRVLHAAAVARNKHQTGASLVMVVDGLDEAEPSTPGRDTGIPLGLPRPELLPAGVHIVATTRYGIPLSGLRYRTQWEVIDVEGTANLVDLHTYLETRLDWDRALSSRLDEHSVDRQWFASTLARQCAGVWMYARYVLDEIADGRDPHDISSLPPGLDGFYLEQVRRWSYRSDWAVVGGPCLAMLAALERPVDRNELVRLLELADNNGSVLRQWLDETLRPFLVARRIRGRRHYAVRHQSLRDIYKSRDTRHEEDRDAGIREDLNDSIRAAHARIVEALRPKPGFRHGVSEYARTWLPVHALATEQIDEIFTDPSFLLAMKPDALLRHQTLVRSSMARRGLDAYQMTLAIWRYTDNQERLLWLHSNAVRMHCLPLAERIVPLVQSRWLMHTSTWSGRTYRTLTTGFVDSQLCALVVDGQVLLASAGHDSKVRLWDARSGTAIGGLGIEDQRSYIRPKLSKMCVIHTDNHELIVGVSGALLEVWDPRTSNLVCDSSETRLGPISQLCPVHVNGRELIAVASDTTLTLWDPLTGDITSKPEGTPVNPITRLCTVQVNRRELIAVASDTTLALWDPLTRVTTGQPWMAHSGPISQLCAVRVNGRELIAVASDTSLRLWDPLTGKIVGEPWTAHAGSVRALCPVLVDRIHLLATVGSEGTLRLWDPRPDTGIGDLQAGHTDSILTLCAVEVGDRKLLATAGVDKTIRLWDPSTGKALGITWHQPGSTAALCAVTADKRQLVVSGGEDRVVRLWDPSTGAAVGNLGLGHTRPIQGICVIKVDGVQLVVSAALDGTIRMWDPRTGDPVGDPLSCQTGPLRAICAVCFSGQQFVAAGGDDGIVRLWDPCAGKTIGDPWRGHDDWILAMCTLRLDGHNLVVTAGHDESVRMWNPRTGSLIGQPWLGHTGSIRALTTVKNNVSEIVASAGHDKEIRFWDPRTGTSIGTCHGHTEWIRALCTVEVDGRPLIVSAGDDRSLFSWAAVESTP